MRRKIINWWSTTNNSIAIYFKNLTLQKKLFAAFSLLSVLPILIAGSIYYSSSYDSILNRWTSESYSMLKYMSKSVEENVYKQIDLRLIRVSQDDNVRKLLIYEGGETDYFKFKAELSEVEKIVFENTSRNFSDYIFIYGQNGYNVYSSQLVEESIDEIIESWGFSDFQETQFGYWSGPVIRKGYNHYKIMARKVYDLNKGLEGPDSEIGYVFAWINERSIREIFEYYKNEIYGDVYIVDNEGNIFAASGYRPLNVKTISEILPKINLGLYGKAQIIDTERGKYLACTFEDENMNMTTISTVPMSVLVKETRQLLIMNVALVIIFIILSARVAKSLSQFFTIPLSRLADNMKKSNLGQVVTDFNPKYNDEVGYLARQFNEMADKLNKQTQQIKETEEKQRKAELKAFEAQIKPHFLYNTLSTAIWLVNEGENTNAISVISALSKMFRISISKGENIISIEKELEHVKSYLDIQNVRYSGEFVYKFEHDYKTNMFYTVKMVLQPLVENAIYHSMHKTKNGEIVISTYLEENSVIMQVRDNGKQMTEEQAKELNEMLHKHVPKNADMGIGIQNVCDRISITFGGDSGLQYKVENGWTVAEIKLPIVEGK